MNVLIVEDERSLAIELDSFLQSIFYVCDHANNAEQALERLASCCYDFMLLDLGLPDKDGLEILGECKKICPDMSIIILTARGDLDDRIKGLDQGADDYLPKPFSLLELQSRMQAISRRKFGLPSEIVSVGDFLVDINGRIVHCRENEVNLSRKEFDIFCYLLLHRNRTLSRMQLFEHVWGDWANEEGDSNYIDVHIKNIRKKLSEFSDVDWLETVRGVGYKIKLPK